MKQFEANLLQIASIFFILLRFASREAKRSDAAMLRAKLSSGGPVIRLLIAVGLRGGAGCAAWGVRR